MRQITALRFVYNDLLARGMTEIPLPLQQSNIEYVEAPTDEELEAFFKGDKMCKPDHLSPLTFKSYPFEVDIQIIRFLPMHSFEMQELERVYCYTTLTGQNFHFYHFGLYNENSSNVDDWHWFEFIDEETFAKKLNEKPHELIL